MTEVLHLINQMSPYLLLGFLISGLLHAFTPRGSLGRQLSRPTMGSVVKSAALGVPLPLCSCGVIPTAMGLRREGASRGAVTAFLIATPQTGVDSIIATYALMGWPFALVRPFAALITSLLGGALANIGDTETTSCATPPPAARNRLREALQYAFVDMMGDIGKWLLVGLLVAGLITVFVPQEAFALFAGNTAASMALVLVIAIPMYLCATGSIPIAVALMLKGLTPGAALVLLMAGPACNFASMLVVGRVMGRRSLLTYVGSIVAGAVAFGCAVDWLQFGGHVDFLARISAVASAHHGTGGWFAWSCTALLIILITNGMARHHGHHHHPTPTDMSAQTYHIQGMNCQHCRAAAERALLSVPGVDNATVDLPTRLATVSGSAERAQLAEAIAAAGFTLTD